MSPTITLAQTLCLQKLESPLILPMTNGCLLRLVSRGRSVVEGLRYANGINITDDGETVYIAEVLGRQIGVYSRDLTTNALTRKKNAQDTNRTR